MSDTGHCGICLEDVPTHDLLNHLRVNHPDEYEEPLRWPDGSLVVDMSEVVEPHEFGGDVA